MLFMFQVQECCYFLQDIYKLWGSTWELEHRCWIFWGSCPNFNCYQAHPFSRNLWIKSSFFPCVSYVAQIHLAGEIYDSSEGKREGKKEDKEREEESFSWKVKEESTREEAPLADDEVMILLLSSSSSLEASLVGAREEAPLADFWIGIFQVDQVCWIYTLSQKDFKVWTTSLIPEFCWIGSALQVKRILKWDRPQSIIYQVIKISRLSWNLFCQAIKTSSLSLECLCQVSSSWLWKCQVFWEIGTSLIQEFLSSFAFQDFYQEWCKFELKVFAYFPRSVCLSDCFGLHASSRGSVDVRVWSHNCVKQRKIKWW